MVKVNTTKESAEARELREIFDDAKAVQDILAKENLTTQNYLHSIPVMLNMFYPDRKQLIDMLHLIVKEATIMHDIMYKKPVK